MKPAIVPAAETDAGGLAALYAAVAADLTARFGGNWSGSQSKKQARRSILDSAVYIVRDGDAIIGTLRLKAKKPWAIDTAYFEPARAPIYLHDLAIHPDRQRQGLGRHLMSFAEETARAGGHDAIRLDAYDHAAGAGGFYVACGYTERGRVVYRDTPLTYFEKRL
jgi:GNAT superfamily N-acetyltransferase